MRHNEGRDVPVIVFTKGGAQWIEDIALLCSALHKDSPGALYRLLEPLAKHEISLTRIESRPSRRRKWEHPAWPC